MELSIDRYRVERLLGQGAMGKVYLAHDPKLGRDVAVKVLAVQTDAGTRERFRLEARAITALKHPNIVELYDYAGAEAHDLFLVMEYLPGRSLDRLVREHGPMSETTALCVAHEITLALENAHGSGVIHRDIKPENILLTRGRVVLTDFGIAKAICASAAMGVERVRTRTQILGTPGFMAPEQLAGQKLDARADIFGVGATLYFLTTDHLPFEGNNLDEIFRNMKSGHFRDARDYSPLLSDGFADILRRCLGAKPKDRFQSASHLLEALLAMLQAQGVREIRKELADYEKNPAHQALMQRERNIDVLVRDLKVALKDHNKVRARSIIQRMQTLAPLDHRRLEVSGVRLDAAQRPVLDLEPARPSRVVWWALGFFPGAVGGAVAGAVLVFYRFVPRDWLLWVERAEVWLREHVVNKL